jgi:hypothetical protein
MIYLLAIFISPVYFIVKKRWGAFLLNSIFYGTALLLLLSIVGALFAFFPWMIAAIHAVWDLRKQLMEEQATIIAQKMAGVMRQTSPPGER